ncbi:T9SS C-terminal target domain-containing protein [Chryseobacterium piperi]|uniref:T9SS type A sorting domain-containing protein n=1 Tax=Chryseobacterium piperi TaxID=558152 RepID=UPI00068E4F50|nr:T9SS type A sorting domain-containing protein [Chryseobacterium piperi]ASW75954.1 T9SS C-terminal target domain-containing protein [Chryseobacterium piperi]
MRKIYSLVVALATATVVYAQTTITQWNFDDYTSSASTGSGMATVIVATGDPTFPAGNPGRSWSVAGFPVQGTGSGTAGFQFEASTEGYSGITVSVDMAGSNTGSKYYQMQYTANGSTWIDIGAVTAIGSTSPLNWTTITNSIPSDADHNPNFAFRVVSVFDPANNSTYAAIGASSNYNATSGTGRVDNVTISGTGEALSVSDVNSVKPNFIKNTFVKDDEIIFGAPVRDMKVYNMYGMIVKQTSVKEGETINVSELQKGSYIVTGIVNNEPVSQKILKD